MFVGDFIKNIGLNAREKVIVGCSYDKDKIKFINSNYI